MKKIVFIFLLALILLMSVACNKQPAKKPEPPGPKIGVQLSLVEKDIAEIIKKEMQKYARKKNLQILWKEPVSDFMSLEKNVEEFIKQGVKVIIIQFLPHELTLDLARKAIEKDIKIIAIGTLPIDVPVDGFVAPDNFRLGQLQGQYVLEYFEKQGLKKARIVLYEFDQRDYAFSQVTAGTLNALGQNPAVKIEVSEIKLNEIPLAASIIESELLAEKDLQAVILQSSSLAVEANRILETNENTKDTITVGLGAGKQASALMAQGRHEAEADLMPEMLAITAIQAADELTKNDTWQYDTQIRNGSYDVPAKILPVRLIKQENIFLLKERWGEAIEKQMSQNKGSNQGNKQENQKSGGNNKSGQGSGGSGSGQMKLKIKTKNGETLEINLPGEIEQLEVQRGEQKQEGQGQGQGQSGGAGSGQGSGGQS